MRIVGIIFLVIVVLALSYWAYKLIFKAPADGTPCSSTGGSINDGTIVNGACVVTQDSNSGGLNISGLTPIPASATLGIITNLSTFQNGDNVYLSQDVLSANNANIYTAPNDSDPYKIGSFHADWYGVNPIGTFVEQAGNDFVKINLSGFQVYRPYNSGNITKISGQYFIRSKAVSRKPY